MSIFTVNRVIISHDTVEIDVDAIRETIPATITQEAHFGIFGDKGTHIITRPNVARMAADAITITSVRFGEDNGEIHFFLTDKPGKKYVYDWYPDYDGGSDEGYYHERKHGDYDRLHHEKIGPIIPREMIVLPDGTDAIMPEYRVEISDLDIYINEIISYGHIDEGERLSYVDSAVWRMH